MISRIVICIVLLLIFLSGIGFSRRSTQQHPVTAWIFVRTFITWLNIVLIAIIQLVLGSLIFLLLPVSGNKKRLIFHWTFSRLCKIYIITTFPTNRKVFNPSGEDFRKPAVIIGNHQSLIDTPFFLQLHPKILILTNNWVWNSPVFGLVARMASYYNAEDGIDKILEKLKKKVSEGYSILIFPEAHRFNDHRVHRFHKGAFFMAQKLQLDIVPVVTFGTGEFLRKGQFFGRPSGIRMKILKRVNCPETGVNADISLFSKKIRRLFSEEYETLMIKEGTGHYFRKKLSLNYTFKGPAIWFYLKRKLYSEDYYQPYNELVPRKGKVLDIGSGYGFLCYMLHFNSLRRNITGVDINSRKIKIASECWSKTENINFICSDIAKYDFEDQDAIILGDVLNFIGKEQMTDLLDRCLKKLNPHGRLIIRKKNNSSSAIDRNESEEISEIAVNKGYQPESVSFSNTSHSYLIIQKPDSNNK